ncbi:hypothetical protein FOA52_005740 [Chlamydomonas sp. UWO 241]|nr:hypothetical protein FOA52_005740 [Chlamydomonas sp. UWO 241]
MQVALEALQARTSPEGRVARLGAALVLTALAACAAPLLLPPHCTALLYLLALACGVALAVFALFDTQSVHAALGLTTAGGGMRTGGSVDVYSDSDNSDSAATVVDEPALTGSGGASGSRGSSSSSSSSGRGAEGSGARAAPQGGRAPGGRGVAAGVPGGVAEGGVASGAAAGASERLRAMKSVLAQGGGPGGGARRAAGGAAKERDAVARVYETLVGDELGALKRKAE